MFLIFHLRDLSEHPSVSAACECRMYIISCVRRERLARGKALAWNIAMLWVLGNSGGRDMASELEQGKISLELQLSPGI